MDRRDFLTRSAVGASGVVVGGGLPESAGAAPPKPVVPPPSDMDEYVRRVERGVDHLSGLPVADRFPGFEGDRDQLDDLTRKSLHTLFVAGMFGDLPVDKQLHPGMQDRLWASQETMDQALAGVTDYLTSRTTEQLDRVRSTLRDRPEVLEEIIRTVDEEAEEAGLSEPRRAQLRAVFNEASWRMKSQPPRIMIDEYVSKVDRATASDIESEARQRWIASRYGEEVFWQAQQSLRQQRISRGLRAMGIGVLLFGAGLALVAAGDTSGDGDALVWLGLVPGVTGGSILFVVGLVTLLVGAATPGDATVEDAG